MTQTVIEADPTENQMVEEVDAQDDLDSLLNEFTEETKIVEQPKVETSEVTEAVSWINEQRAEKAEQVTKADINSAVDTIKDSIEIEGVSKRVVRGLLQDIASEDKAIQKAFAQRKENPQAWQSAIKRATKGIKEELSVDQKTTSDREAITSAVHSASTKQPTPDQEVDFSNMSDSDFARHKMNLIRKG